MLYDSQEQENDVITKLKYKWLWFRTMTYYNYLVDGVEYTGG